MTFILILLVVIKDPIIMLKSYTLHFLVVHMYLIFATLLHIPTPVPLLAILTDIISNCWKFVFLLIVYVKEICWNSGPPPANIGIHNLEE